MDQIHKKCASQDDSSVLRQQTSMGTLINWNISKAIEANPSIDLKSAIKATHERLQRSDRDVSSLTSLPEEQYLACALLAWQQLGHSDADSLHQFVEKKQNEVEVPTRLPSKETIPKRRPMSPGSFISYEDSVLSRGVGSSNYDTYSLVGPVVKLPVETKIVMRLENKTPARPNKRKSPEKDLMNKIDAACCMESACMEKLSKLDKSTTELRTRAERLARREAERVELLERAEAAWRDLEQGYQRRLAMAEEKEEDMAKHIKKLIEERNNYKNACTTLATTLRERGETAEKERAKLTQVEKEVCENACMRLKISEEAARLDAILSEQQCKGAQLDRDLQFKEEQVRRKMQTMESELESSRCLTHEAERALHAELGALRQQVARVSAQLLEEDAENARIKEELEVLRQEKLAIVENLDGCKVICDGKIQAKMDALKTKREQLKELRERVMECQCKMPVDVSVEAKRTPSLAALCKCSPEDKFVESCSCTSLRSSLLSNLLADLFGGLQAELPGCGSEMPCQLLKCLEDRHNWDKSSIVKTNLRNYFSQLLIGELDIAIATAIEKYHAKWVGASCADAARIIPDRGGETEGWQERALERRAQKLAAKLAEQLFKEREEQLTAKAKEIVKHGPPPCECKPRPAAVYPVLVKQPLIGSQPPSTASSPAYWRRTHQDVTQLRVQLEDLKKDSIKKEDLKVMEENIVKLVQRATVTDDYIMESVIENSKKIAIWKGGCINRSINTDQTSKQNIIPTVSCLKKKQSELNYNKGNKNVILGLHVEKPVRSFKKMGRSYAVNMCLCGSGKDNKTILNTAKRDSDNMHDSESKKSSKEISSPRLNSKQKKPVKIQKSPRKIKPSKRALCRSDVACFHKKPSNTSIDKLLETLAKWKCDLTKLDIKGYRNRSKYNIENIGIASDCKNNKELTKNIIAKSRTTVSKNLSALPYRSNVIVANVSKSMEVSGVIPITTESEYMGAVNLDCAGSGNREPSTEEKPHIFKCIHSPGCNCKTFDDENKQDSEVLQSNDNINTGVIKDNKQKILENNVDSPDKQAADVEQLSQLTNDCQYCIKFLGVTLTNVNSNKNVPEKDGNKKNERPINKKIKRGNKLHEVWYNGVKPLTRNTAAAVQRPPICDCSVKYDEVKNLLIKEHGDFNQIEDKALDTPSFQQTDRLESCVCCEDKWDESKELEVNAFHLLEEHLREKLEEFKLTHCKSSCIKPEEEEKLFSSILQKVKQIITENTTGMTCKCAPEDMMEGSWHRAYKLLEEYLKIKIKRVQCLCLPSKDTNPSVLPNVLEKVCTLIDNDFKRLKEVCKCSNEVKTDNTRYGSELPEKDVTSLTNYDLLDKVDTSNEMYQTEKINKEVSNNSILVTQNISSQISPNLDTSTKSCDAMPSNRLIPNKCCKITEINYDGGFRTHSTKITKSFVELFGSNDVFVNHLINMQDGQEDSSMPVKIEDYEQCNITGVIDPMSIVSNTEITEHIKPTNHIVVERCNVESIDLQNKIPYIGYTVDCSCDAVLGACTCTKSLITGKNDNINSIWNTLTSNKLRRNNISYIMDAVANKNEKETVETNITDIKHPEPRETCDSNIGVKYYDEIILKDSNEKLNKNFTSTTTSGEDLCYSPNFNEPIDWCECTSNLKQSKQHINVLRNEPCASCVYYPVRNLVSRGKSAGLVRADPINFPRSFSSQCDCNMVPMCHVKMLVENIENKLIHSKCTCDSLSAKICPVHSRQQ